MSQSASSLSLKKNVFFNILYHLIQIGVPILLIPIMSGRLGTEGNGAYAFIHSIVLYFSYFALLGVNYYGSKTIAAKRAINQKEVSKSFWCIFGAKAFTSSLAIFAYLVFCFIYWKDQAILFTQIFFLVSNLFDISWFFMGEENFKGLCVRNLLCKTLSFILIVLLVNSEKDIWLYSLILASSEFVGQGFLWITLFKKKMVNLYKPKMKEVFSAIKGMSLFFIPQLLIEFYTIFNTTVLGIFWSSSSGGYSEVAIFDYANKIVSVLTTITVSLGMVFLARMSYLKSQNKTEEIKEKISQSLYSSFFISIPLVLIVMGTGHSFVNWFLSGDNWGKVGTLLLFLPLKVFLVAISNTIGVQFLIPNNRMKEFIISIASGAIVCVLLNLLITKELGAIGSSICVLVSEFVVSSVQLYFVRKDLNFKSVLKELIKPLFSGLIVVCFIVISYFVFYDNLLRLFYTIFSFEKIAMAASDICIILVSVLIYFFALCIFKERFVTKTFKLFSKKRRHIAIGINGLLIFSLILSLFLFKGYNITFDNNFSIVRRTALVKMNNNSTDIKLSENVLENSPMYTIEEHTIESKIFNIANQKEKGIKYHYYENKLEIISYTFTFEHCQSQDDINGVGIKICIENNKFFIENIENINICLIVNDINAENKYILRMNNRNNVFEQYFNNVYSDFVCVNGSDLLWSKNEFKYIAEPYYLDKCYCTICVFAEGDGTLFINDINQLLIRQEVWLVDV